MLAFVRTLQRALWYAPKCSDSSEQIRIPKEFIRLFGDNPNTDKRLGSVAKNDQYNSSDVDTKIKLAGTEHDINTTPMYIVRRGRVAGIPAHLAMEDPLTSLAVLKFDTPIDQWIYDLLLCDSKAPKDPNSI